MDNKAVSERWRKLGLHGARMMRRLKQLGLRRPNCTTRYVPGCPDRLLIAPQDLRTTDPTVAEDIYAGLFVFAGQVENCDARSPFLHQPPSDEWASELQGFRWLRHLRAADAALAKSNAQALVDDWITTCPKSNSTAWALPVVANRVLAWLNNSPLILQDADHDFYRRFIRALYLQIRYLRAAANSYPNNEHQLLILSAELAGWLCLEGKERYVKSAAKRLEAELEAQILPDGGHISRNSIAIINCLIELLPLRQAFLSRDMVVPDGINRAIERMMPMLRFFRHPNGEIAHFNGAGATPVDQLATILAYDEARGAPVNNASHSGYQRMEAGSMTLLMDCGKIPPLEQSTQAHAGTLAFEMSVGQSPMVINCGAPAARHASWRELARSTAAHSTLIIQDSPTCIISEEAYDLGGRPLLSGPSNIECERSLDHAQETILAHHDGYQAKYGIRHQRQIWMAIDGRRLDGRDEMIEQDKKIIPGQDSFAIRFHLHPSVQIEPAPEGNRIYIALTNGEIWQFVAQEADPAIEESVFLSDIHGIRPSKQLVIHGNASHKPTVNWYFERVAFAPA